MLAMLTEILFRALAMWIASLHCCFEILRILVVICCALLFGHCCDALLLCTVVLNFCIEFYVLLCELNCELQGNDFFVYIFLQACYWWIKKHTATKYICGIQQGLRAQNVKNLSLLPSLLLFFVSSLRQVFWSRSLQSRIPWLWQQFINLFTSSIYNLHYHQVSRGSTILPPLVVKEIRTNRKDNWKTVEHSKDSR